MFRGGGTTVARLMNTCTLLPVRVVAQGMNNFNADAAKLLKKNGCKGSREVITCEISVVGDVDE